MAEDVRKVEEVTHSPSSSSWRLSSPPPPFLHSPAPAHRPPSRRRDRGPLAPAWCDWRNEKSQSFGDEREMTHLNLARINSLLRYRIQNNINNPTRHPRRMESVRSRLELYKVETSQTQTDLEIIYLGLGFNIWLTIWDIWWCPVLSVLLQLLSRHITHHRSVTLRPAALLAQTETHRCFLLFRIRENRWKATKQINTHSSPQW